MIALSNLAFPADAGRLILPLLASEGLAGVEVAPTRIGAWSELTPGRLAAYRAELAEFGLVVPSLQAILFQAEGVALLGDNTAFVRLLDHLRRVADVAAALGAGLAVFGSPRQRSRGDLPSDAAFALGAERLRKCAELCFSQAGLVLGLEPVPQDYGGDFLETAEEALAMVQAVQHPGLQLHLDTACVLLGGGDIAAAIRLGAPWLAHFHAAEPQLTNFEATRADHPGAAAALAKEAYAGWISIEMREMQDWETAATAAFRFVRDIYDAGERHRGAEKLAT